MQHVVGWPEVLQRSYRQQGKDFGLDVQTPLVTVPIMLEDGCRTLHKMLSMQIEKVASRRESLVSLPMNLQRK